MISNLQIKGCLHDIQKLLKVWFLFIYFSFIFISWRLITLQYCSGFCHTLARISPGFTLVDVSNNSHTDYNEPGILGEKKNMEGGNYVMMT